MASDIVKVSGYSVTFSTSSNKLIEKVHNSISPNRKIIEKIIKKNNKYFAAIDHLFVDKNYTYVVSDPKLGNFITLDRFIKDNIDVVYDKKNDMYIAYTDLNLGEINSLFDDLIESVNFLHSINVAYGGMKENNILVDQDTHEIRHYNYLDLKTGTAANKKEDIRSLIDIMITILAPGKILYYNDYIKFFEKMKRDSVGITKLKKLWLKIRDEKNFRITK